MTGSSPASVRYPGGQGVLSQTCYLADPGEVLHDPDPSHTRRTKSQQGDASTHGVLSSLAFDNLVVSLVLPVVHLVSLAVVPHLAHSDGREFLRTTFEIRCRLFGPRTHSGSPVWLAHVTRCQQERTLCWGQSRPTDTTNLECVSVVQQLHPPSSALPLVLETSLGDHWRPIPPPTGSGSARPQL